MKIVISLLVFTAICYCGYGQSIIGTWQLVKESNCMEEKLAASSAEIEALTDEMKARSSATPVVVKFKEKMAGEESIRVLTKRKSVNNKNFWYRFDGEMLVILDKKSRTITDSFTVERFDADSLIVSNASRPCETRVFVRIK
jgi:hypothetical protein